MNAASRDALVCLGALIAAGIRISEDALAPNAEADRRVVQFAHAGAQLTHRSVLRAVTGSAFAVELSRQEQRVAALLRDPVTGSRRSRSVSRGQHRVCQARTLNISHLLVRIPLNRMQSGIRTIWALTGRTIRLLACLHDGWRRWREQRPVGRMPTHCPDPPSLPW